MLGSEIWVPQNPMAHSVASWRVYIACLKHKVTWRKRQSGRGRRTLPCLTANVIIIIIIMIINEYHYCSDYHHCHDSDYHYYYYQ